MNRGAVVVVLAGLALGWHCTGCRSSPAIAEEGYVVQTDSAVAREEPGPHKGKGMTTGYVFFDRTPGLKFSFRKRVLHPGASIGYHTQLEDEVYYVIGGQGKMTINGQEFAAKPGDAFLTRTGSSHGLEQTGRGDLTVIIAFSN